MTDKVKIEGNIRIQLVRHDISVLNHSVVLVDEIVEALSTVHSNKNFRCLSLLEKRNIKDELTEELATVSWNDKVNDDGTMFSQKALFDVKTGIGHVLSIVSTTSDITYVFTTKARQTEKKFTAVFTVLTKKDGMLVPAGTSKKEKVSGELAAKKFASGYDKFKNFNHEDLDWKSDTSGFFPNCWFKHSPLTGQTLKMELVEDSTE